MVVGFRWASPMESGATRYFRCSRPVVIPLGQAPQKSERHMLPSILSPARITSTRDDAKVARRTLKTRIFRRVSTGIFVAGDSLSFLRADETLT